MRGMGLVVTVLALPLFTVWGGVAEAAPVSFAARVDVPIGPPGCDPVLTCSESPLGLVAGDLNGDTFADAATANNFSADVSVLSGNGAGGLTAGAPQMADAQPTALAAGDLNADQRLDLVVANEAAETVSVLLAQASGGFAAARGFGLGTSPSSSFNSPTGVVLSRLNGDAYLDIATANFLGDTISVLLGVGDGTFGLPRVIEVEGGPIDLAAGDFNNDRRMDLVVSANLVSSVTLLLGRGDGAFAPGTRFDVGEFPAGLVVGDFDADMNADVAVVSGGLATVSVLLGRGDGSFDPVQDYDVGGGPESIAAADFNGDGFVDLATADMFGTLELDNSVSVLAGRGDGTFDEAVQFAVHTGPTAVAVGDLNGDRKPDLLSANTESNDISVLINTAQGGRFGCLGDCNDDDDVSIDELLRGVDISLGRQAVSTCGVFDQNSSGQVEIDELVGAVHSALDGCSS